jgi:uncharacterized protein
MPKLTREMKNMIATQQCFIGTVDPDGKANVAPKRSTRVLSETSLIFTEATGGATYANLKRDPKITVSVVNRDLLEGYRFIGDATIHESGELFDQAAATSLKTGLPRPFAVVVIEVTGIFTLKPGPTAGKMIE